MVHAFKGGMPAFISILGMSTWENVPDYQAELAGGIHPCVLDIEPNLTPQDVSGGPTQICMSG